MASDAPLTPQEQTKDAGQVAREGYIHRVLVGFDQFMGSVIGLQNDQTISSATEIAAHKKVWYSAAAKALNDGLDVIQKSHGQQAQVGDIVRAEEVIKTDTAALQKETGTVKP
jgi:hypothetical protein